MSARAAEEAIAGGRLAYLDNLKVLLVVGVIAVHSAITYGVDGSWYLEDYDSMADVSVGVLTVFVAVGFLFRTGGVLPDRGAAERALAQSEGTGPVRG
jgi:peptidoglycan/LPS O-acetylase OafA/YrhL